MRISDWSSDVCSSDLLPFESAFEVAPEDTQDAETLSGRPEVAGRALRRCLDRTHGGYPCYGLHRLIGDAAAHTCRTGSPTGMASIRAVHKRPFLIVSISGFDRRTAADASTTAQRAARVRGRGAASLLHARGAGAERHAGGGQPSDQAAGGDRKSTRLNSSH